MASNKPTVLPYWTRGLAGQVAQPPTSLRDTGFTAGQAPAAEHINQLFYELGQYINFLDDSQGSSILAATLDSSVRLLGGGILSYAAGNTTLSWSQPFTFAVPSIPYANNVLAAGSAVIAQGSVAYTNLAYPFSSTADITQGSTQAVNLAYELPVVAGQAVAGQGIPAGTTVASIQGSTVTLSQPATVTATQSTLTFSTSGPLNIQVAPIDKLVPNANTVVLAIGMGTHVLVGVNAAVTTLHDGEQKTLLEPGYQGVLRAPAGQSLNALQAVYISADASGTRTQGAAYAADTSTLNGANRASCVGFTYSQATLGATVSIMTGGILPGFVGLTPGLSYWLDPATPGGITSTRPALSVTPYVVRVGYALTPSILYVRLTDVAPGVFKDLTSQTLSTSTATITGQLLGADGGTQSPGLSFSSNVTTGLAHLNNGTAAQETLSIVLGGLPQLKLTTAATILTAPAGGGALVVNDSLGNPLGSIAGDGTLNFKSVVSGQGFRNTIFAGFLSNASVSTGSNLVSPSGLAAIVPVTASGSVLAVTLIGMTASNIVSVDVYKNNTLLWASVPATISGSGTLPNAQTSSIAAAAKKQYAVAQGDTVRLVAKGSAPGGSATATGVYLQAYITIEEAA